MMVREEAVAKSLWQKIGDIAKVTAILQDVILEVIVTKHLGCTQELRCEDLFVFL